MSAMEARVVLQDAFDMEYGIFNHADPDKNPLCSSLLHERVDRVMSSPLSKALERFAMEGIGELWNISLNEYLALPRFYVEIMERMAPAIREQKRKVMDGVKNGKL